MGNTATSPQAGQDRPITAVMILGLDETTQPRYKVTITSILGARVPKNVQIGRKNGMDAVRWGRLGFTDSSEDSEIVVARAIGGSNDEKPIP